MSGMRHITSARNALRIVEGGVFRPEGSAGSYDGGMNLLGVLGEYSNTQPKARGAELHCSWTGDVSGPHPWDAHVLQKPGVMLDYNGSGACFSNNDPRYLLPIGSEGLRVDRVEIQDLKSYFDFVVGEGDPFRRALYRRGWMRTTWLDTALAKLQMLNQKCARGEITVRVA